MPSTVLLVCTANVARSPLAAVALAAHVTLRGLELQINVRSAGVQARRGDKAAPKSVDIARQWDLDLTRHLSRPTTDVLLSHSDLILTMEQEQRDRLSVRARGLGGRCFTLAEYARLLGEVESNGIEDAPPFDDATERLSVLTRAANLRRPYSVPNGSEDVDDPIGRSQQHFVRMANAVDRLTAEIAGVLFGPVPEEHP